jgi:hypothetical protein
MDKQSPYYRQNTATTGWHFGGATNGGNPLKMTLSQSFIIKKLSVDVKPILNGSAKSFLKQIQIKNHTLFSMTIELLP